MKVAMLTPHYTPAVRGNAVTVRRIERNLAGRGCDIRVFSRDTLTGEEIVSAVTRFTPDIVHAFHGYYGGMLARLAARKLNVSYVVTLTGTDLHEVATDHRNPELAVILEDAAALVTFDQSMNSRIQTFFPNLMEKVTVIPQGIELPESWQDGERGVQGEFNFFLPAGLRPVKDVLFPLAPLAELYRQERRLRFLLAGPILDAGYASEVLAAIGRYSFARYLGEVDHQSIWSLYQKADVVLNTSQFEGGMPNSVMEALAAGCPVLASAIEGNKALVKEGKTGFLYRDREEFRQKAGLLLSNPGLCRQLGAEGARFTRRNLTAEREGAAYMQLYIKLAGRAAAIPSSPP